MAAVILISGLLMVVVLLMRIIPHLFKVYDDWVERV